MTASKDSAIADGIDYITLCVVVKRDDGTVVTDIEPIITGLRSESDANTLFVFNSTDQTWCTDVASTAVGTVSVSIEANNVSLATKDLLFTEASEIIPTDTPEPEPTSGMPLWLVILLGLLGLLLVLFILWWLYKRLKDRGEEDQELENLDDDTGPAYPGDEPEQVKNQEPTTEPPSENVPATGDETKPETPAPDSPPPAPQPAAS